MLNKIKEELSFKVYNAIKKLYEEKNISEKIEVSILKTPKIEFGEIAIPLFNFVKALKVSPKDLGLVLSEVLKEYETNILGSYLNIKLERPNIIESTIENVLSLKSEYGKNNLLKGKKIVIEFSCPNTNKPLHLGHLRNNALGESLSRILKFSSAETIKVNLINDRGIHICKSMLSYIKFGNNITPQEAGIKGDHLVGNFYVKYNEYAKSNPNAESEALELLKKWEEGESSVIALWQKMNKWVIDGIMETYKKSNISFERVYFESELYKIGRDEVLKGLEKGILYKRGDGAICIDIENKHNFESESKQKVLLRADGTSIYLTQDIGVAIMRERELKFDLMLYVVGSEQAYHFETLFYTLKKLGFTWADNLIHVSYGMVNLPDGKMKSREGNVVDADDLIEELEESVEKNIKEKNQSLVEKDLPLKVALGALNYFLLKHASNKEIVFNKAESLSFNGNSGPYIQYTCARINSIIKKYKNLNINVKRDYINLKEDIEWELILIINEFQKAVEDASKTYNPSLIVNYLYNLAKNFSFYYQNFKIINENAPEMTYARIKLIECINEVLKNGMDLLNIPYIEKM